MLILSVEPTLHYTFPPFIFDILVSTESILNHPISKGDVYIMPLVTLATLLGPKRVRCTIMEQALCQDGQKLFLVGDVGGDIQSLDTESGPV